MDLRERQDQIHAWARRKGWYDGERNFGELMTLLVTEVAEAFEEWRNGHDPHEVYVRVDDEGREKPEGVPIELADLAIRLLDTCAYYGIDLDEAIEEKMAYNATRPYRHGGKRA